MTIGNKIATNTAIKTVSKIEEAAQKGIREGLEGADLAKFIRDTTGTTEASAARAIEVSGIKPHVVLSRKTPDDVLDEMITKDSATSRLYSKTLDNFLGILHTRIKGISPVSATRMRRFEFGGHTNTSEKLHKVAEFSSLFSKLPTALREKAALHLFNGEFSAARSLMKFSPKLNKAFELAEETLKTTGDDLQGFYNFGKLPNYFPRIVKDLEGLLKSLGTEKQNAIGRAYEEFAKKSNKTIETLTFEEKSVLVDRVLRGGTRKSSQLGSTKARAIDTLTPEQLQYYHSPQESIQLYMRRAVNDMETRKFFGKELQNTEEGLVDVDSSIGSLIVKAREEEGLTTSQVEELSTLLSSRFKGGNQSPKPYIRELKNLGYLSTIANARAAVTNLSDTAVSGTVHGFRHTLAAMFSTKNIKMMDLGLEKVSAEMEGASKSGRLLEALMSSKLTNFKLSDRFGKETLMNAAFRKYQAWSKSDKGRDKLQRKWKTVFGDEYESFVADLQAGRISENVKFMALNDLSDVQPISLSEMPQPYLDYPDGRIFYALKSYTLKMYDIVRREIVQEFKHGSKTQAVTTAARLATALTIANVGTGIIKDLMLGREIRPEDLPDRAFWALLGPFGMNKYAQDRYLSRGDFKGWFFNTIAPPTPLIDDAISLGIDVSRGDDPEFLKRVKSLPAIGPFIYNWFGGGAEAYNESLED